MISTENNPVNSSSYDDDFTVGNYRELLQLAKKNFRVTCYANIPWGDKFVLWRHDMDISLNRGLSLAKIENAEGVKATYFLNPHSEFYNIAELSQCKIIQDIILNGHDIGLHFDAAFYNVKSEKDLDVFISQEANYLYALFGVKPTAFSFHNPVTTHLDCEEDYYGGLMNCYSKRFKEEVPYCSDSNGYWRFRRLYDVLKEGKDYCLQVLTHPGWWQDKPISPRQKIFRAVYGRASAILDFYDEAIESHGRINQEGASEFLRIFKKTDPRRYELLNYLWNQGHFDELLTELWSLHETQIIRLCRVYFYKEWNIPSFEVDTFFKNFGLNLDVQKLFYTVFKVSLDEATKIEKGKYTSLLEMRNHIVKGFSSIPEKKKEESLLVICEIIENLANCGLAHDISYDGLSSLDSINWPTSKKGGESLRDGLKKNIENIDAYENENWALFKLRILNSENDK